MRGGGAGRIGVEVVTEIETATVIGTGIVIVRAATAGSAEVAGSIAVEGIAVTVKAGSATLSAKLAKSTSKQGQEIRK
jgi:hypothetical protein